MPYEVPVVFVDVNIVSMDTEKIVPHQTVITNRGRIVEIGEASKIALAQNALRVDGRGRYLMPGLADMHTHTWGEADFLLFLASGVTTIRNMWGSKRHLLWRKRIAKGEILGPTIFTAGPIIDGSPPVWNTSKVIVTREEARDEVRTEKELGYDFVKVYNRLSLEVYNAIIESSRELGMPVAGHVPTAVGLETALKSGQTIEHLTGYIDAVESDDSPVKGKLDRPSRRLAVEYIDERKIDEIIAATVASGVWNCVTLIVGRKFVPLKQAQELLREPIMRFVPPAWLSSWDPSKDFRLKDLTDADFELLRKRDSVGKEITRRLRNAGARILLGTDNPNPFVVPGFSIIEELQNLVDAGLTPYEAIKAGTRDAAEFLKALSDFGTVEVGKKADLILVKGNPLDNIENVSKRVGIMVHGQWFTEDQLESILEKLVDSYKVDQERLARAFDPALRDTAGGDAWRYMITSTNTELGEERVLVRKSADGYLVESQQVLNAPPRMDSFKMQHAFDETWISQTLAFQSSTSEGNSNIRARRERETAVISGTWPDGENLHLEKKCPADYLLGTTLFGGYLPIGKLATSLQISERMELKMLRLETDPEIDFTEATFRLERREDYNRTASGWSKPVMVFSVEETTSNSSYTDTIRVGDDDMITYLERVEQMGVTRFEMIERKKTLVRDAEIS